MQRKRLTDLKIRNMRPPAKRTEVPDPQQPGLWLQLHPTGRKSWGVRYRRRSDRKNRCLTLDGFPSLAIARRLAQAALDEVAQGGDPCADKQEAKRRPPAASDDVESALRLFLEKHVTTRGGKAIRMTTRIETARLLGIRYDAAKDAWEPMPERGVLAEWQGRKLSDIKAYDVRTLVEDRAVEAPIAANRTLAALKSFFNFHRRRNPEALPSNPCETVDMPSPARSRDRVLSDVEIGALWRCAEAEGYVFGRLVQLLLLTATRRDECREAVWSEFSDLDGGARWIIPGSRVKNSKEHSLVLPRLCADLINNLPRVRGSKYLFTVNGERPWCGAHKAAIRLRAAMEADLGVAVPHFVLHDLRRTAATNLSRLGFPIEVTEAVLNHSGGTLSGVAAIYSRHRYDAEKLRALEAWASHIQRIVDGSPASANVVPLRAAA